MSNSSSAIPVSRTKTVLHFHAGEPAGRPLWEWAYRTPRFPRGIKGSDLQVASPEVQRETMATWFLANHVPASGPYFGFSEAAPPQSAATLNTSALNTTAPNSDIQIVGFGQGRFFNGGRSIDLLRAEFKDLVQESELLQLASHFEGIWDLLHGDTFVNLDTQTPDQRKASLVAVLDGFADTVRRLPPEHGGLGHNQPPEDVPPVVTEEERQIVLQATAETKLAVLSSDYSRAILTWKAISPIVKKVGTAIAKQIENACTKYTSTVAVGGGLMTLGYIGNALGFWTKAEAISTMLELAKLLPH